MKVLLIDDEEDTRTLAGLVLRRLGGFEVAERGDARRLVETVLAESPDAVLLDVMLPEVDGPTALAALRADPRTEKVPVAFFTAKAMDAEVARLKDLGAQGVITKPFRPESLVAEVRALASASAQARSAGHDAGASSAS